MRHTALVRTLGLVHKRGCELIAGKATAWYWAEGRPNDEVRRQMAMVGSRACPVCKPAADD